MPSLVSVTLVTTNDAHHIPRCVASLVAQNYAPLELIVVDNASTDGSAEAFTNLPFPVRLIKNENNDGFSISQNRAIANSSGDWVLCLNPDTRLDAKLILELVRIGEADESVGILCPKILRLEKPEAPALKPALIDSAGACMAMDLRHYDRGSQEVDRGQYDNLEYVFGYTGAIVLFRRKFIDDVSVNGEFMDEDFYIYREDADLSWRAQLLGWRCLYVPTAVGWHVRRVFAANRRSVPTFINMHSTKNRFLMRINNITGRVYRKVFWKTTLRDLAVLAYVFTVEWSSIPGLWWIIRNLPRLIQRRRNILARRRADEDSLAYWFSDSPASICANESSLNLGEWQADGSAN